MLVLLLFVSSITELASLACMVMLETLDVSNNSLYGKSIQVFISYSFLFTHTHILDLPVLLQCVRGCYQLRGLVVSGNPVSEEPKLCHYITKALPCLVVLDDKPLKTKVRYHTCRIVYFSNCYRLKYPLRSALVLCTYCVRDRLQNKLQAK